MFIMRLVKRKYLKMVNVDECCGKDFQEVISHYTFGLINRDFCPIVFQNDFVKMKAESGDAGSCECCCRSFGLFCSVAKQGSAGSGGCR